jgi:hypothetical protein
MRSRITNQRVAAGCLLSIAEAAWKFCRAYRTRDDTFHRVLAASQHLATQSGLWPPGTKVPEIKREDDAA